MSSGLRAGRYELLSRLASGGMGEVFIARKAGETRPEDRVALKLLLPHLSDEPEFVQMFLDEARIAARMNHPNIVQILDLGEADGRYFISMSLIEGVSLSGLLKSLKAKSEQLPLPVVRLIAQGLCEGLAYAHELVGPRGESYGIVHRDVNPANLLVSTGGQVLLTDFGIAKTHDSLHRTRPGDVRGKYAYMAPEQMRTGSLIDRRADIFAAAVTVYEMLTLVSPFGRRSDPETIEAVKAGTVAPAHSLRPEVSASLSAAVAKGMSRNPDERFPSARELLAAVLDGPVATPDELGALVRRLCVGAIARFQGYDSVSSAVEEIGTRSLARVPKPETALVYRPPSAPKLSEPAALAATFVVDVEQTFLSAKTTIEDANKDFEPSLTMKTEAPAPRPLVSVPRHAPRASRAPRYGLAGVGAAVALVALGLLVWLFGSDAAVEPEAASAPRPAETEKTSANAVPTPDPRAPTVRRYEGIDLASDVATALATELTRENAVPEPKPSVAAPAVVKRPAPRPASEAERVTRAPPLKKPRREPERTTTTRGAASAVARPGTEGKFGYLTADATPWATVMMGGKELDRTPISRPPLPVGEHVLVFRNPGLRKVERRRIRVEEGRVVTLKVDFDP